MRFHKVWRAVRLTFLWLWHQFITFGLMALVVIAVYVGLGREFVPAIVDYKPAIERWLARQIGVPVQIGELGGRWDGLSPVFVAEKVALLSSDSGHVLFQLPEVRLVPALWDSVWYREPRLRVTVNGVHLHLRQEDNGHWQVQELAQLPESDAESTRRVLSLALRQPELRVNDIALQLVPQTGPELSLLQLDATLTAEGGRHGLDAHWLLASRGHSSGAMELRLLLRGDPMHWRDANIQGYVHAPSMELSQWLPMLADSGTHISRVSAGGDAWVDVQEGAIQSVTLNGFVPVANIIRDGQPHSLLQAHGLLRWQRQGDGFHLYADTLQGVLDEQSWHLEGIRLDKTVDKAGDQWTLGAAHLDVDRLSRELLRWLPEPSVRSMLSAMAPKGWLSAITLGWQTSQGHISWQSLRANVSGLSWNPYGDIPGVQGLDFMLAGDIHHGGVVIKSPSLELHYPQQFKEVLRAEHLEGVVEWDALAAGGWQLTSSRLRFHNSDANGSAVLRLSLPTQGTPSMSLLAGLDHGQAQAAWKYVPWTVAGQETVNWLHHAVPAGQVNAGAFFYDGALDVRLPHRFQMQFQLHNTTLEYQAGWPRIDGVDATVNIDEGDVSIRATKGHLMSSEILEANARILLSDGQARLDVDGSVSGPGNDAVRLFRESPLKSTLGEPASDWDIGGRVNAHIALKIPLTGGEPDVDVQTSLNGNSFAIRSEGIKFSELSGALHYSTSGGLVAPQLQAKAFGHAMSGSIQSQMHRGQIQALQIDAKGSAAMTALSAWSPSPLWRYFTGDIPYQAQLQLQMDSEHRNTLSINSDLNGVRCSLPAPLAKGVEPLPIRYTTTLGGKEQFARLGYGKRFGAAIVWRDKQLVRAGFRFGSEEVGWPLAAGITVDGRLNRIIMDDWLKVASSFQVAGSGSSEGIGIHAIDVDTRDLQAYGRSVHNAHLKADRDGNVWSVAVHADRMSGTLRVPDAPDSKQPIVIHMNRVFWPIAPVDGGAAAKPSADHLPVLDVTVDELQLEGQAPAAVHLRVFSEGGIVHAEDIGASIPGAKLAGQAIWVPDRQTHFKGTIDSNDLSKVFALFHLPPQVLAQNSHLEADISWLGDPWALSASAVEGGGSIRLSNGRIISQSGAVAATHVVGLFNFAELGRRLRLDFKDLTEKGVAFDNVDARLQAHAGILKVESFVLKGPAMTADGNGTVNLSSRALNMQFAVTVPVTRVLPIAAAVVAGPVIGGAVLAVQSAFSHPLEKLTTLNYRLGGDWVKPEIKLVSSVKAGAATTEVP